MGVKIAGILSGLDVRLVHGPSGAEIRTTPPVDNGGDGSAFSPTDLCAASLGACAVTIVALFARRNEIPLRHVEFEVEKEMSAAPRRIERLTLVIWIDSDCSDEDFRRLVGAAKTCPVRLTLGDRVEIVETYQRGPALRP
ncbi:MAG: OsmC family protein [Acidobacteria bacterium]|nr:OsmC family protein [Acidobacteriota bacterium]